MPFEKPSTVRRSFARDSAPVEWRPTDEAIPFKKSKNVQTQATRKRHWPKRLDYQFLEGCKEVICRIEHPTAYYKHPGMGRSEYRLSVMPWSRGAYVDIRMYRGGRPTARGILLHLDVAQVLLPELVRTIHRMEAEDTREPGQKARIVMLPVEGEA